jgi:hypothetical protein
MRLTLELWDKGFPAVREEFPVRPTRAQAREYAREIRRFARTLPRPQTDEESRFAESWLATRDAEER